MLRPGAPRSTDLRPTLEKYASWSELSVAATVRTFGRVYDAGYVGMESLSVPLFPAAATNSAPWVSATAIASASACEYSSPPQDLLSIDAPLSAAEGAALPAS